MNNSSKTVTDQILVFTLDELTYAFPLHTVVRIIQAVESRYLPKASENVLGIVSFHGEIIPVINIRKLFNLSILDIELDNQFIIVQTSNQLMGLIVDSVVGIYSVRTYQQTENNDIIQYTDFVSEISKVEKNIVFILDLQKIMDEALTDIKA